MAPPQIPDKETTSPDLNPAFGYRPLTLGSGLLPKRDARCHQKKPWRQSAGNPTLTMSPIWGEGRGAVAQEIARATPLRHKVGWRQSAGLGRHAPSSTALLALLAAAAPGGRLASQEAPRPAAEEPVVRRQNFPGHGWIPERELEAQLGLRPGDRAGPDRLVEGLRRLLSFRFIE